MSRINWYIALLDNMGKPIVTLPNPSHGTLVYRDGVIGGLDKGAMHIWNGKPPVWCYEIIEVRSPHPWSEVKDEEKTSLWRRDEDQA